MQVHAQCSSHLQLSFDTHVVGGAWACRHSQDEQIAHILVLPRSCQHAIGLSGCKSTGSGKAIGRAGERILDRTLSEQQKKSRVVLKRVNLDTWGVRTDFLRSGTMARGAAETGKVKGFGGDSATVLLNPLFAAFTHKCRPQAVCVAPGDCCDRQGGNLWTNHLSRS